MPRPRKCRRVCEYPRTLVFAPAGGRKKETVNMTVDEYETIRLIDGEGYSQEQCGKQMEISRTAVQLVYASARKKLARALVEGLTLSIGGGDYQLCRGDGDCGACGGCYKYAISRKYEKPKGDRIMRIAVTYENGQVFQHFGHTEQFKIYDTDEEKILDQKIVDTNGSGHGALAGFLADLKVDALICGGIGGGARNALAECGIKLYGGVTGDADQAVKALLAGELAYNPDVQCSHHGHGEGEHGGDCHGHHGDSCHGHHGENGHGCHGEHDHECRGNHDHGCHLR